MNVKRVGVRGQALARAARALLKAQERFADLSEKAKIAPTECRGCGVPLPHGRRGRPKVWCDECRGGPAFMAEAVKRQQAYMARRRERERGTYGPGA